jgi:hypothetical protein
MHVEEPTTKRNRRARQEARAHEVVKGALPPTGIHEPNKKHVARRHAERIRRAVKGKSSA